MLVQFVASALALVSAASAIHPLAEQGKLPMDASVYDDHLPEEGTYLVFTKKGCDSPAYDPKRQHLVKGFHHAVSGKHHGMDSYYVKGNLSDIEDDCALRTTDPWAQPLDEEGWVRPQTWGIDRTDEMYAQGQSEPGVTVTCTDTECNSSNSNCNTCDDHFFTWLEGSGTRVYVMDSGVANFEYEIYDQWGNAKHRRFFPNFEDLGDFAGNSPQTTWHYGESWTTPVSNHGTHIASHIAGSAKDENEVFTGYGMAYKATIVSAQVYSRSSGRATVGGVKNALAAIRSDCLAHFPNSSQRKCIINYSQEDLWSSHPKYNELKNLWNDIKNKNIMVVASAGNANQQISGTSNGLYPIDMSSTLVVGSTRIQEQSGNNQDRALYGDWYGGSQHYTRYGSRVDLYAPGFAIQALKGLGINRWISPFKSQYDLGYPNPNYVTYVGTSAAAGFAAAWAAILYEQADALGVSYNPSVIKSKVIASARPGQVVFPQGGNNNNKFLYTWSYPNKPWNNNNPQN